MLRPRPVPPCRVAAVVATVLIVATACAGASRTSTVTASATASESASESAPVPTSAPSPGSAAVGPSALDDMAPPVVPVRAVVEAAERAAGPGMTLGVAVLDVSTGEALAGRDGNRAFLSASLTKLIVAVDMLDRRSTDGRAIADADLELLGRALSSSDDGAMNVLWGRYDGIGAVHRVAGRLGLSGARAPEDPSQWGDGLVTAGDLVRLYQHILTGMAAADRDIIVAALAGSRPTATDGFEQFFGLLGRGASERVYAKQAWVPYRPSGYLLHSAGVVHDARTGHDYAIALLSIQTNIGDRAARDRLSAVAAAALDLLGATG